MMPSRVENLLASALQQGIGSGMAASFGKIDQIRGGRADHEIFLGATGHGFEGRGIDSETFFDLASLTKVLGTTLLAMIRVERGDVSLESTLDAILPATASLHPTSRTVALRELLTHTSGFPAWAPLFEPLKELTPALRRGAFDSALDEIRHLPESRGSVIYSDIGFLLLERILSKDLNRDLARVFSQVPGLQLHYRPTGNAEGGAFIGVKKERVMMTEACPWRGLLQGEVHDDNAWVRGGVAGHAGLFGRLRDVHLWIEALFSARWVSRRTLREFTMPVSDGGGTRRALGFDVPARDGTGSTGRAFSLNSIGHLGLTGTSLWMDLDSGDFAVLLTNRVHPRRTDDRIRGLRREFHEAVRGGRS